MSKFKHLTLEGLHATRKEKRARRHAIIDQADREARDLSPDERRELHTLQRELEEIGDEIDDRTSVRPAPSPDPARRPLHRALDSPYGPGGPAVHTDRDKYPDGPLLPALHAFVAKRSDLIKDWLYQSDRMAEQHGRQPQGIFVDYWHLLSPAEQRDLKKGDTGAGLVADQLVPQEFIAAVRPQSAVLQAGARVMPNLVGDIDIPALDTGAATAWLATETSAVTTDTAQQVNLRTLTPHTVGVKVEATRRMWIQATPGVEEIVRRDIRAALGSAIDAAALTGSGASGQPQGIVGTTGVGAVDLTGGVTWADAVEFLADVAGANLLDGALGYIFHPDQLSPLMTTTVDSGSGRFIMEHTRRGFELAGYLAWLTANVGAGRIVFGNWRELLIGQWGGLDIFADPYTLGDQGGLVLRGFADVDIALRHAASFSVGS